MKNIIIFGILMLMSIGLVSASYVWTEQSGSGVRNWQSIDSSADGSRVVAGISSGHVWTSSDFGVSWIEQNDSGAYGFDVASSVNGSFLWAIDGGNGASYSSNYGLNWSPFYVSDTAVSSISSSGSGEYAYVTNLYDGGNDIGGLDRIYNYGLNYQILGTPTTLDSAVSDDGSVVVFLNEFNIIAVSLNYGVSFTPKVSGYSWDVVDVDSDGSFMVSAVNGGHVWTSSDFGNNWTEQNASGSRSWSRVASSADGSVLVASVDGGFIYTSADYGVTWTEETSAGSGSWKGVAVSSDGARISAVDFGGYVWTAELVLCSESWVQDLPSSCDGLISNFTVSYSDENACGTFVDLPVDNGTIVPCCVESWSPLFSGSCSGQDKVKYYVDANACNTSLSLPVDNGSVVLCDVSSGGGGGSVIVPQSIIPSVTTTSSVESTSFFGNFINSIIAWFSGLFGG